MSFLWVGIIVSPMDIFGESVCKIPILVEACIKVVLLMNSFYCIIVTCNILNRKLDVFLLKRGIIVEVSFVTDGIIASGIKVRGIAVII